MTHRLETWARAIKRDIHALYLASRDPRVPWYVKVLAVVLVGYALSPIDLIPDAIPILGYLDDLVLIPLGLLLVIRLIPPALLSEFRRQAAAAGRPPASRTAAVVIAAIWAASLALGLWLAYRYAGE